MPISPLVDASICTVVVTESTDLSETGSGQKGESPVAVSRTQSNQPVVNSMEEVIDGGGRYTAEMHRTESFKDSASHRGTCVAVSVSMVHYCNNYTVHTQSLCRSFSGLTLKALLAAVRETSPVDAFKTALKTPFSCSV